MNIYAICPYKWDFLDPVTKECFYTKPNMACPFYSMFNNIMVENNINNSLNTFLQMSKQSTIDSKYAEAATFFTSNAVEQYKHYSQRDDISLKDMLTDLGKEILIEILPDENVKCIASGISLIDSMVNLVSSDNKTYHSALCALKICKLIHKLTSIKK